MVLIILYVFITLLLLNTSVKIDIIVDIVVKGQSLNNFLVFISKKKYFEAFYILESIGLFGSI